MSNLNCPFYENGCILKQQVELPEFKEKHNEFIKLKNKYMDFRKKAKRGQYFKDNLKKFKDKIVKRFEMSFRE